VDQREDAVVHDLRVAFVYRARKSEISPDESMAMKILAKIYDRLGEQNRREIMERIIARTK